MDSSKIKDAIINNLEIAIIKELFKNGHINEIEFTKIIKKLEYKNENNKCDGEIIINENM